MLVSESPREEIGINWIIAIAALLMLLVVSVVFYLRMSAPLHSQPKRTGLLSRARENLTIRASAPTGMRVEEWV